jgi:hypothetical protein
MAPNSDLMMLQDACTRSIGIVTLCIYDAHVADWQMSGLSNRHNFVTQIGP